MPSSHEFREYFVHIKGHFVARHQRALLGMMSPALRAEIAHHVTAVWVRHVPMFKCDGCYFSVRKRPNPYAACHLYDS